MELYEEITLETLQRVSATIKDNDVVRINSNGGDIFAAISIYNILKEHNVTVEVVGLAASAASLIAQAGAKRRIASNALMMLHNPALYLEGCYNRKELERFGASLVAAESSIIRCYDRTAPEVVRALLDEEKWLTADEAVEANLADEVMDAQLSAKEMREGSSVGKSMLLKMIADQIESGSANVKGSVRSGKDLAIEKVVAYANARRKVQ